MVTKHRDTDFIYKENELRISEITTESKNYLSQLRYYITNNNLQPWQCYVGGSELDRVREKVDEYVEKQPFYIIFHDGVATHFHNSSVKITYGFTDSEPKLDVIYKIITHRPSFIKLALDTIMGITKSHNCFYVHMPLYDTLCGMIGAGSIIELYSKFNDIDDLILELGKNNCTCDRIQMPYAVNTFTIGLLSFLKPKRVGISTYVTDYRFFEYLKTVECVDGVNIDDKESFLKMILDLKLNIKFVVFSDMSFLRFKDDGYYFGTDLLTVEDLGYGEFF